MFSGEKRRPAVRLHTQESPWPTPLVGKKPSAQAQDGLDATAEWHLHGLGYHRELSWKNRGPVYKSSTTVSSTSCLHSTAENPCLPEGENTWGLFWGGQGNGGGGEDEQLRGSSFPLNSWGFGSLFCQGCPSLDNWYGEIPAQLLEQTPKGSPLGICGYFIYPWDNILPPPSSAPSSSSGLA